MLGVEVLPHLSLVEFRDRTARFRHTLSARAVDLAGVDTLVLAEGPVSDTSLEEGLADYPGIVRIAGDCLSPRTAEEAVLEGLRAGLIGVN